MRLRGYAAAASFAVAALVVAATAVAATNLAQKPGTAGCVTENGIAGQCQDGRGLVGPRAIAISPDGDSLYVASEAWDSLSILTIDPANGAAMPISNPAGCFHSTDSLYPDCTEGRELDGASDVAISPDETSVYVAAPSSNALVSFNRDPGSGELSQPAADAGCINETGASECGEGRALDAATGVAVSPDSENVYVASRGLGGGIAIFDRDPETGILNQKSGEDGCVNEEGSDGCADGLTPTQGLAGVEVSPDGAHVYVFSPGRDAITIFTRDTSSGDLNPIAPPSGCIVDKGAGGCQGAIGLGEPAGMTFDASGEIAYVASERRDAVLVFERDPTTGALEQKPGQAGCISNTGLSDPMQAGTAGHCQNGTAMDGIASVAVLPDGSAVYAAARESDGLVVFERHPDGSLTQRPGTAGCITETGYEVPLLPWTDGVCDDGRGLLWATGVVTNPDSRHVYSIARQGGVGSFDVVEPPSPPIPTIAATPPVGSTALCLAARKAARKAKRKLEALKQEIRRKSRRATFVTTEAERDRINAAADRDRRKVKGLRKAARKAAARANRACA